MDLSALSKLSAKKTQSLQNERQRRFDRLYRMGAEYLRRARKEQFQNRALVKRAAICFGQAIENNRRDPRPLVKLAYISLVFRDAKLATRHLNEALRLEPGNAEAKKLQAHLEKQSTQALRNLKQKDQGLTLKSVRRLQESTPVQGENLYLQTQQLIQAQIRESFELMQGIRPTLVGINLNKYEQIYQQLEANYDTISRQLDQLEAEGIQIEPLERELQKLEINLNQLEDTCKLSRQMMTLKKIAQSETERVQDWNLQLETNPTVELKASLDAQFDAVMERCDALADELDELEGSGFDIQPLMKYYQQLTAACSRFEKLLQS